MSDATPSTLRLKDLRVGFETEAGLLTAVDGVTFDIPAGTTVGLVGESGCGKSVTAFSIMRLLPQPMGKVLGGSIEFQGKDLAQLHHDEMFSIRGKEIGIIFQEPMTALNPVQRIEKQLREVYQLHDPEMDDDEALAKSIELLDTVGIPAAETRIQDYPHQLSGGMRQRVVIAMALANKPDLLIADEPTTALDVTVQAQILKLIAGLQKEMGMSVLLITHDLGVIAQTCDEVVVMYAGRVVERAPVEELFAKPVHAYTRGLLASIPSLDHERKTRLPTIEGNVPSLAAMPTGCRFADRSPVEHDEHSRTVRAPLEEISPGHWVEACPHCTQQGG